jgi:hypothetical protein
MEGPMTRFARYRLIPTWIDVDISGWELEGDVRNCHETFSEMPERDAQLAKRWANKVIGRRHTWRRVENNGLEHYEAG